MTATALGVLLVVVSTMVEGFGQVFLKKSAVEISRPQSIAQPMRCICSRIAAMLRSVTVRGCPPSLIAAFSAGRPNAS